MRLMFPGTSARVGLKSTRATSVETLSSACKNDGKTKIMPKTTFSMKILINIHHLRFNEEAQLRSWRVLLGFVNEIARILLPACEAVSTIMRLPAVLYLCPHLTLIPSTALRRNEV